MSKLNQILAVEKGLKAESHRVHTDAYQLLPKPELFNGFSKTYKPKDEAGETYPPENKRVQYGAHGLMAAIEKALTPFYDVSLTRDLANCNAKADLVIDGYTIATGVPATHLLFLEKHLGELKSFVDKLPTLDQGEDWTLKDDIYKSEATQTHRTKKVQKPLVLHPPTKEHPAQTQMITEDEVVGFWTTVKMSGALKVTDKVALAERIDALLRVVQKAREAANAVDAPEHKIGHRVFDYVFRGAGSRA